MLQAACQELWMHTFGHHGYQECWAWAWGAQTPGFHHHQSWRENQWFVSLLQKCASISSSGRQLLKCQHSPCSGADSLLVWASSLHTPCPDSSPAAWNSALKASKVLRSWGKIKILPVKWQWWCARLEGSGISSSRRMDWRVQIFQFMRDIEGIETLQTWNWCGFFLRGVVHLKPSSRCFFAHEMTQHLQRKGKKSLICTSLSCFFLTTDTSPVLIFSSVPSPRTTSKSIFAIN